jgi:peroxiredoxin
MKTTSLTLVLATLFWSCGSNDKNYEIFGEIDIETGKTIYRIAADANNQPVMMDSATIDKGAFTLKGPIAEPTINFIQVEGIQGNFPIILEGGKINLTLYKDSLTASVANGTVSNDDFMKYKSETKAYIKSINAIGNDMQQALILKDSLLMLDLKTEYDGVRQQIQDYELNFIESNPDSYVSALILERFAASKAVEKERLQTLYDAFSDRIKNTPSGRSIATFLNQPASPPKVGEFAPNFEGPTPTGNQLALKGNLGKATLLEFWASWCRPCRVQNPNLVALHQKMAPKGFKIIAVSLDKTKNSWLQAIEDDGLVWDHVSHLQHWNDPIAKQYHIQQIPASLLLDAEGKIVAKDLNPKQLEARLAMLLE